MPGTLEKGCKSGVLGCSSLQIMGSDGHKHGEWDRWLGCDQVLPIAGLLWVSWPKVTGGRLKEDPVLGC